MKAYPGYSLTVFLLLLILIFTGCLTPRKMDKWVGIHYEGKEQIKPKSNEAISFQINKPEERTSETEKIKSSLLPLLFYWQWKHTTGTSINTKLVTSAFSTSFIPLANTKGVKAKLGDNKLIIRFDSNPADFTFHENGSLIYLVLAYIGWESILIQPKQEQIGISYLLTDKNGIEIKKGKILIHNPNKEKHFKKFQSLKKLTWSYLDDCEANLKLISRELTDKLLAEL